MITHLRKIAAIGVLASFSACSISGSLREDPKAKNFKVGKLPDSWRRLAKEQSGDADIVFENTKTGSFLSVNSVCGRYPDTSLESLTNQLLVPIQDFEVKDSKELMVDERAALMKDATGRLDGVPVQSRVVVVRKNQCIFDFSLLSKGTLEESELKDFDGLVQGFSYD